MKKLTGLVIVLLVAFNSFAGEIKFVSNLSWKQIKEKAAREKKMIFFDAYTSWCGPCKYLEKDVYTNDEVAIYFNKNFINVKFNMEEGEGVNLAEEFGITAYPTLLFFSPEGKLVHKYIGAMDAAEFIGLGKDATNPERQYFVLKGKAAQLKLTDADFGIWASQAEKLEDDDLKKIMDSWLSSKADILGNTDIANTVLKYTGDLNDKQLSYLHANLEKIGKLMEWDADRTASVLYKKLFRQAAAAYERTDNLEAFRAFIKKFNPAKENYAVKDLQFKVEVFISKDMNKATGLLLQYFRDTQKPVAIDDLAGWVLDYSSSFETEHFQKLAAQMALFKFRSIDKDKEYWLYLAQVICYTQAGDTIKARSFAEKAYHHPRLPVEYKEVLKESYGF